MENRRNGFRSRSGIQLRTALVLVSIGANPFFNGNDPRLLSPELDLYAWKHQLTKRVLGNERGMAAFGNCTSWISPRTLGRHTAFRECVLRRRHGKFRDRGSNRQFRFANIRRGIAAADYGLPGPDGICRLSEAHAKPDRHQFWIELWDPFLKSFGGWARPRLCSRPSLPLSWRMGCFSRLSLFAALIANGSSRGATNESSSCASNGTRLSQEGCPITDGGKKHLTAASSKPWRWTHSKLPGRRNRHAC